MRSDVRKYIERDKDPWGLLKIKVAEERKREIIRRIGHAGTVIDVGGGFGFYSDALRAAGNHVICIDFSSRMIRDGKKIFPSLNFVLGDGSRMPIKSSSADAILCMGTMIYVKDREAFVKEMVRCLKPCGKLLLIERNRNSPLHRIVSRLKTNEKGVDDMNSFLTLKEIRDILKKSGLKIKEISGDRLSLPFAKLGGMEKMLGGIFPQASYFLIALAEK